MSFTMHFGGLLDVVHEQRVRPSNWYVADDSARQVTEQLIRDAGFDPVRVGDLSRARNLQNAVWLLMGVKPGGGVFYRFAAPGATLGPRERRHRVPDPFSQPITAP